MLSTWKAQTIQNFNIKPLTLMSLNKVMLIGNVGRDPDVRYLDGNGAQGANAKVASFTLATTERYRDRTGNLQENTEWHNIVAFRNSADLAEKYIRKGSQIYVEGRLRTRSWTDQTGNKKYTTEIVVDNIQLLGRRSDNPASQSEGYPAGQPAAAPQQYQTRQQAPVQPAYSQPQPVQPAATPIDINLAGPEDDLPF